MTNAPLTEADLARAEALFEKATPPDDRLFGIVQDPDGDNDGFYGALPIHWSETRERWDECRQAAIVDQQFYVMARTEWPRAVAEVRRLRAKRHLGEPVACWCCRGDCPTPVRCLRELADQLNARVETLERSIVRS